MDILRQEFQNRRKQQGLTLQDVSDRSGVSLGALSMFEQNKIKLRWETCEKVANALGIKIVVTVEPMNLN